MISHALDKEKAPVTAGALEDEYVQNSQPAWPRALSRAMASSAIPLAPPMQKGASFNLAAVKEELDKKMAAHAAQ